MNGNLWICLLVCDRDDNTLKQTKLNFLNPNHRVKIAKCAWWAMHNGHTMTTWPLDNGETVEEIDLRAHRRNHATNRRQPD